MEPEWHQHMPEPIEPERAVPNWLRPSFSKFELALDLTYAVFCLWLTVNVAYGEGVNFYRAQGHNRARTEEKLRNFVSVKHIDNFFYPLGKLGREYVHWLHENIE